MADKSPAFQFYPKDFLTDEKQVVMSLAEAGAYIRLLSKCWLEGSLPADLAQLARLCGATRRQMKEMWPALGRCFQETEDGRLRHGRLDREREKQETYRQRQSDHGRASAAKRATNPQPEGNQPSTKPQPAREGQPEPNSSVSDLPSPSPKYIPPPAGVSVSDDIAEKAGAFLGRYPEIYAEERRGAHFPLHKPVMYYDTACKLVTGWPDLKRLELMFRTFCQLPTSEKMAWPGTPAQFLHLAPEIDVRLRQIGA